MALSQQAQTLSDSFTAGLTADQRTNFDNAVRNSPALAAQINTAVASGDLRGFSLLPAGTNAGGQYDPAARTMQLPASILTSPAPPARFDPGELTFTMGHEVQHALNRPGQQAATAALVQEVNRIGQSPQVVHDYTQPIAARVASHRENEATAHIAGFNATVSMLNNANPGASPSLEDIYRANPARMQDFISVAPGNPSTYALRTGLTLAPDMTLPPNAANTEAVGRHFVDKPASSTQIGPNGDSNYQNYYATAWVGYAAQVERANAPTHAANGIVTQMHLNMNALGVNEVQLERNGLNLGGAGVRQPYFDTSTQPPTQGNLDHTEGVNRHVPIPGLETPAPGAPTPPQHPAIQQAIHALDHSPNIPADAFNPHRLHVAAGVALHAVGQELRADHIIFNNDRSGLIAVQGGLTDPGARLSTPLPIAQALATDPPAAQRSLDAMQPPQGQPAQPGRDAGPPQHDAPQQEAARPAR